ncbi:hypothetical protein C5S35_08000 [Candidatus Methanophagaceae archaeon]|nr:hypothetical protein C5S35_08000 [Methanophagales archaeon]
MILLKPYEITSIQTTVRSSEDMMRVHFYESDSGVGGEVRR